MLRTLSSGAGAVVAPGAAGAVSMVSVIETRCAYRPLLPSHPTSRHHPRMRVVQYSRDACYGLRARGVLGPPLSRRTTAECLDGLEAAPPTHHPSHSGLRGNSTVLTFSSLIVPFAIRSLISPSVVPEIFERYRSTLSVPRWSFSVQVEGLQTPSMPAGTQSFFW